MIRAIEELSMNAWPSLQMMLYDGWVLRFADGYTRRSNSINPIYPSNILLNEKIEDCEKIYCERGLKVVYKITSDAELEELDGLLEERGYSADAYTSVQLLDMASFDGQVAQNVSLADHLTDEWLAAYCPMSRIEGKTKLILTKLLNAIVPARCFASLKVGEEIVACGMGVFQDGYIGLFDIVTDARYRRQGHGWQLVSSLLAWGKCYRGTRVKSWASSSRISVGLHVVNDAGKSRCGWLRWGDDEWDEQ